LAADVVLETPKEQFTTGLSPFPSLFNVYINDLPQTASRKFIYADNICLGAQRYTFTDLNDLLNGDMDTLVTFSGNGDFSQAKQKLHPACSTYTLPQHISI